MSLGTRVNSAIQKLSIIIISNGLLLVCVCVWEGMGGRGEGKDGGVCSGWWGLGVGGGGGGSCCYSFQS